MVRIGIFLLVGALGIANIGGAAETGPVEILQKKVETEQTSIVMPIIAGLQDSEVASNLNQMLAGDMDRGLEKFLLKRTGAKFFADYSVKYNRNDILSIATQQYSKINNVYTEKLINAYTVNVSSGKVYSLFHIFRLNADYNSRLTEFIKKESVARRAKYSIKRINDTQPFYLTDEGVVVYFMAYELSPKQRDVLRFVVPYEVIKDILNSELCLPI